VDIAISDCHEHLLLALNLPPYNASLIYEPGQSPGPVFAPTDPWPFLQIELGGSTAIWGNKAGVYGD
jgi:hypothetical protein